MRIRTLALAALLLAPMSGTGSADDVPAAARRDWQAARDLLAKGDVDKAYSAIVRAKDRAPQSVDFWETYVLVWRAAKRPEKDLADTLAAKRREAGAQSPVFDLLDARLEKDPGKKRALLQAALEKDAASVEARLGIARLDAAQGNDDEADQGVNAVLKEHPDDVDAATLKVQMLIDRGETRAALDFAEEILAKKESPAIRLALAKALRRLGEVDGDKKWLDQALESARKAVAGNPDPEAVLLLAELLQGKGLDAEAATLLETQFARTGAPRLGAMLGRAAFEQGKYDAASKGLAAAAGADLDAAKALAICQARIGKAKEARDTVAAVLARDAGQKVFAATVDVTLGDGAAARQHLEGASGDEAVWLRGCSMAWDGMVPEVTQLGGDGARSGSRGGEEWLLLLCQARAFTRLGAKAPALRAQLIGAEAEAAKRFQAPKAPEDEPQRTARSTGFMERYVTYRRSLCGPWFEAGDLEPYLRMMGEKSAFGFAIRGNAECDEEASRLFPFNMQEREEGKEISLSFDEESWNDAEKAFADGAAGLVDGDATAAGAGFAKALEKEPAWARARLFGALAKMLDEKADLAAPLAEAKKALEDLPEDAGARRVVVLLEALTGQDISADVLSLSRIRASYAYRRYGKF